MERVERYHQEREPDDDLPEQPLFHSRSLFRDTELSQ